MDGQTHVRTSRRIDGRAGGQAHTNRR